MVTEVPEVLPKAPLSPTFSSTLLTNVPSGTLFMGSTFPTEIEAFCPQYTNCPWYYPSTAIKYSVYFANLYGFLNSVLESGAPLPVSWTISLTTPLMYPSLSAKSKTLY